MIIKERFITENLRNILQRAKLMVRDAPAEERRECLNDAAYVLGGLVAKGELTMEGAMAYGLEIAEAGGMPADAIEAEVALGVAAGRDEASKET